MPTPIAHVSDTCYWVAMYRALESERPDALFRDPFARPLAGARGEAILRALPQGRSWAWPMVVRTAVIDALLRERLRPPDGGDPVRTVVNLAAGLDARPYRLDLPADLRWLDVDLPAVQAHKRAVLAAATPRCQVEWWPADLAEPAARAAVLARAAALPGPALVLTEGLLIYLEEATVRALARELAACPPVAWWLLDLGSPRLLRMLASTWGRALAEGGAPFRFGPAEGTAFFAPLGWREAAWRSTWGEAQRLRRTMPLGWLWARLGRLAPAALQEQWLRMSGMALLAREEPGSDRYRYTSTEV